MKTILLIIILVQLPITQFSFGQLLSNQVSYGNNSSFNFIASSLKVANGYLIAADGNGSAVCSQANNGFDFSTDIWVYKIDNQNQIVWQKMIGGSGVESILSGSIDASGPFSLLSFYSTSTNSGNINIQNYGGMDGVIAKLNSNGDIIWSKNYGTSGNDVFKIKNLNDSNYILFTSSTSGIDNDKTEASYGLSDFWLISIDSSGTILWDKSIGGTGTEYIYDVKYDSVEQKIYILGSSDSDISGLKTQDSYGSDDAWLLKLDLQGNIENQITLGGAGLDYGLSILINEDDIWVSCRSSSGVSGNKELSSFDTESQPNVGDVWLVKLTKDLDLVSQYVYGGGAQDSGRLSFLDENGNLILTCNSRSGISGVKTEPSRGAIDIWLLSINPSNGEIVWQKSIGGSGVEEGNVFEEDSYYKVISTSSSPVSGDKTININCGQKDIWIFDLSKTVGLDENEENTVNIYPNPFSETFSLDIEKPMNYILYDMQGKQLENGTTSSEMSLASYPNGVYFLHLVDNEKTFKPVKLMKQ